MAPKRMEKLIGENNESINGKWKSKKKWMY